MNVMGVKLVVMAVVLLVCTGAIMGKRKARNSKGLLRAFVFLTALATGIGFCLTIFPTASYAQGDAASVSGWGYLGAALSAGLGCLGAGIAVAIVGSSALGVVGEKPEMLGSTLIFLGLAEGIAIYGLIIALLILGRM